MQQLKEACQNENYPMIMIKVMEWLLLLLEQPGPIIPSARTCYTATQVRIAKTAEALITENLAVHYSAKELSKRFHISETSLKNYFRGVFGQSYSAYQREIRMKTAARLLEETSDRIAFIAGTVGYENQSKFASAFSGNMVFPRRSTDKTNFWTKLRRKEDNSFFFCKFHCYLELFFFDGADNRFLDCYTEKQVSSR